MVTRLLDLSGQRFGELVAISRVPGSSKHVKWLCLCDCGATKEIESGHLRSGRSSSCGHRKAEANRRRCLRHGHTAKGEPSPTYRSWQAMHRRCTDPTFRGWASYGGRGIKVCERWQSFDLFLEDMGERPEGRTLDRIDPNGFYEPTNCRWATRAEQDSNKRPREVDAAA